MVSTSPQDYLPQAVRPDFSALGRRTIRPQGNARIFRLSVVLVLAVFVLAPVMLIANQAFLDGPFFQKSSRYSLASFSYVLADPLFYRALSTTVIIAFGTTAIAVPIGAMVAFLVTRTDLPFKAAIEVLALTPAFISSIILAFGYVITLGPSGFLSLGARHVFGVVPWDIYSVSGIIFVCGLSHAPYAYLYIASAMRQLPADLEEAARMSGATVPRVFLDVTLPLALPSTVFAIALILLVGLESFGIPLVLGDAHGIVVLTTYMHKLAIITGTPAYHLMAVVAVLLVTLTGPIVLLQRRLMRNADRYATIGGKSAQPTLLCLGQKWRILAFSFVCLWLLLAVGLPLTGIVMRAFVSAWGLGINPFAHLTLLHFEQLLEIPIFERAIINTVLMASIGGLAAVLLYLMIGLAGHRAAGYTKAVLDYLVLMPRAVPGLVIGLAFFWLFLFVPAISPLRLTLVSMFVAYAVVGLSYGLRLIQGVLMQVKPELEESARTCGAGITRTWRDITAPIIRPGLIGAWALIMLVFVRDYTTGVYLMSAGTEVIGSLMVSLTVNGAIDVIAALSVISVIFTTFVMWLTMRLGGRINA